MSPSNHGRRNGQNKRSHSDPKQTTQQKMNKSVETTKQQSPTRDVSGHTLTLHVIPDEKLPPHVQGKLYPAIGKKWQEIKSNYPEVTIVRNKEANLFEIAGENTHKCIKVKQLLTYEMVDTIFCRPEHHSSQYILEVASRKTYLKFIPDRTVDHLYRLGSTFSQLHCNQYPNSARCWMDLRVVYSNECNSRDTIMNDLKKANCQKVMTRINLGGMCTIKHKSDLDLRGHATTGPYLFQNSLSFRWEFDRESIFEREKMKKMIMSLGNGISVYPNTLSNIYSIKLYDSKEFKDITIRLERKDPDQNGISRFELLKDEGEYQAYDMSNNKAFYYYVDDTSGTSYTRRGYCVKFWEGDDRVQLFKDVQLIAESLIYNHNLGLYLFSESTTDPLFQDPSGRFWIKKGQQCTEESYGIKYKGREYKLYLYGNQPGIQLGPYDVYSTNYEKDYLDLMAFGKYLIDQYTRQ